MRKIRTYQSNARDFIATVQTTWAEFLFQAIRWYSEENGKSVDKFEGDFERVTNEWVTQPL